MVCFKAKASTYLFLFSDTIAFPDLSINHLNLSWFPRKATDLKYLHSKSGCHLCSCYHYHICSGLFLNTMIWSCPQNMQYCTQASTLEKINYYTCIHKLSSFAFDDTWHCRLHIQGQIELLRYKNIKALRGLHCLTDTD